MNLTTSRHIEALKEKLVGKNLLIGIVGHKHNGRQLGYGNNARYIQFFRNFGNVVILDALCDTTLPLDLLVLPGGADVNPDVYGHKPHITTGSPDLEYEYFMKYTLPKYMKRASDKKVAIYGICAGFQHLIANTGGSLVQDIDQVQSSGSRGELVDKLDLNLDVIDRIMTNTSKYKIKDENFNKTNSIHHQGAYKNNINEDVFEIVATNKDYKNVEFIVCKHGMIAAEQSHPEERRNPQLTLMLLEYIINNLKK